MKKLLLLLSVGVIVSPAFAQQNTQSVVFNPTQIKSPAKEIQDASKAPVNFMKRNNLGGSKKTTANNPFWYSYADVLYQTGVSKLYYNVVYQDSNVTYVGTSGINNVFTHGMGMSFDPVDSAFYFNSTAGQIQDYDYVNQDWKVTNTQTWSVDSFAFLSKYYRTQNVVDSMIIYIAKVKTSGANPTGLLALTFTAAPNENFITAWYDSSNNNLSSSIPSTAYTRMAIALDAAYFGDTSTNGWSNKTINGIALPSPITCAPGEKILAYVHFKSGTAYPLGTPVTAANYMRLYSYDLKGQGATPVQNKNSYQAGLVATSQLKYAVLPADDFTNQGHSVLIPNSAYAEDGLMTDMSFRVSCPNCPLVSVGISETPNPINNLKVYPNPSNNEVLVSFTLTDASNATVTISNTVGQVLKSKNLGNVVSGKAHFTTSDLASGLYFYSVEANGKKSTGRFVVSH